MNLKKIGLVSAFLLASDLTFVGCSGTRQVIASVAPTAEQVEIASRGQISPYDPLLRQAAEEAGMDWRFLAARNRASTPTPDLIAEPWASCR